MYVYFADKNNPVKLRVDLMPLSLQGALSLEIAV